MEFRCVDNRMYEGFVTKGNFYFGRRISKHEIYIETCDNGFEFIFPNYVFTEI